MGLDYFKKEMLSSILLEKNPFCKKSHRVETPVEAHTISFSYSLSPIV